MPNHKTHERVGVTLAPLVATGTLLIDMEINHAIILITTYIFATYYITPDLDTDSMPYHRWGIFRFIWYPYKKLIPHRSFLSHSTVFSGTLRFVYFAAIVWLLLVAVGYETEQLLTLVSYYAIIWLSIVLVDTVHTFLDLIWKD